MWSWSGAVGLSQSVGDGYRINLEASYESCPKASVTGAGGSVDIQAYRSVTLCDTSWPCSAWPRLANGGINLDRAELGPRCAHLVGCDTLGFPRDSLPGEMASAPCRGEGRIGTSNSVLLHRIGGYRLTACFDMLLYDASGFIARMLLFWHRVDPDIYHLSNRQVMDGREQNRNTYTHFVPSHGGRSVRERQCLRRYGLCRLGETCLRHHRRVSDLDLEQLFRLTDGDHLPVFISPEF